MKKNILILLIVAALMLVSCGSNADLNNNPSSDSTRTTTPPTSDPLTALSLPDVAAGQVIFAEKCAPCHGETGLGDGPLAEQLQKAPAALANPEVAQHFSPSRLYEKITDGISNSFMPPFNNSLSDQQRWDVSGYVFTLAAFNTENISEGKTLYEKNCLECHGADGSLDPEADLTDQSMIGKLTQNDIAAIIINGVVKMPGVGNTIPSGSVDQIAAYVRSFTIQGSPDSSASDQTQTVAAAETSTNPSDSPTEEPPSNQTRSAESTQPSALTPAITPTPESIFGSINGQVVNSTDGLIPADLLVTLHGFALDPATQQYAEKLTQDVPISKDGNFHVENISFTDHQAFYVSVVYSGSTFSSQPIYLADDQTTAELSVTIFGSTPDQTALKADQVHLILDYSKADMVQVLEFLIFSNQGNQTIVAEQPGGSIIAVPLPKGYTNLQFESGKIGDRYLKTSDGFADTTPINPGEEAHQIVFTFAVPLSKPDLFGNRSATIDQPIPFNADKVTLLAPDGIKVNGSGIQQTGVSEMSPEANFNNYTFDLKGENKAIMFTVSGKQGDEKDGKNSNLILITLLLLFLGLALIVGGVLISFKKKKTAPQTDEN